MYSKTVDQELTPFAFSTYDFLWLAITLLSLLVIAALLPLTPQDYWWYVRLGRDIAQTGSIPVVDTYSYTRFGASVYYQSWLSALIFWLVFNGGGIALTFFLRTLVIACAYGSLWVLVRSTHLGVHLTSLLVLLAGLAGSSNWAIRPQLLTYPLFILALFILWSWQHDRGRMLWLLPLISLLWVNLHGSYPLMFLLFIPALFFGNGDRRKLLVVFGISSLALLINPHGLGTLRYVADMLNSASNRYSLEWLPTVNRGWHANLFFLWLLLFVPLLAWSKQRPSLLEWVWFVMFGWLALYGARYIIWFLFILALLTSRLLTGLAPLLLEKKVIKERRVLNLAVGLLLLLLPLPLIPGIRELWWARAPNPYHAANPVAATAWLADHPHLRGPLWSDFSFSSYLIFDLPSRPVWIDPRFELYPVEHWQTYIAISTAAPEWQDLINKEGLNLLMLSTAGQPDLIRGLRSAAGWCELYRDADAVIFSRGGICMPASARMRLGSN